MEIKDEIIISNFLQSLLEDFCLSTILAIFYHLKIKNEKKSTLILPFSEKALGKSVSAYFEEFITYVTQENLKKCKNYMLVQFILPPMYKNHLAFSQPQIRALIRHFP